MAKIKKKCLIIGAGTYGQVYSEYLSEEYKVLGFLDDNLELEGSSVNNYPILGAINKVDEILSEDDTICLFVPIGNNTIRVNLLKEFIEKGYKVPCFIHPSVTISSSVVFGKAFYVLPNSSIMPFTRIKDFVMISMGCNIAHHVLLEQGVFLSQGSNIGASIRIKKNTFVGIASTIMTGVKKIGKESLIGAGAVIIKDIPDYAVVVGNPGKVIKYKKENNG